MKKQKGKMSSFYDLLNKRLEQDRKEKMKVKIYSEENDISEFFGVSRARGKELYREIDKCYTELPQTFSFNDFLNKVYNQIETTNVQEIAFVSFYTGQIVNELNRSLSFE